MEYEPDCIALPGQEDPRTKIDFDTAISTVQFPYGDGIATAGYIEDQESFSKHVPPFSETDIPLKEPGNIVHTVPDEYARFLPVLKQIANYEFGWSEQAINKKATLLVEHIVPPEDYPEGIWHQEHTKAQGRDEQAAPFHVYTVSDCFTTLAQFKRLPKPAYDSSYPRYDRRHMDDIALPEGQKLSDYFRFLKPYEIGLMSGRNIHRADILPEGAHRTLLRVIYEMP